MPVFEYIKFPRGNYETDSSETKTLFIAFISHGAFEYTPYRLLQMSFMEYNSQGMCNKQQLKAAQFYIYM